MLNKVIFVFMILSNVNQEIAQSLNVFGEKLDVIIHSDFGIEIADGYNPALLNDKCTLTIVGNTSLSAHKQELKDYFNNIVEEP